MPSARAKSLAERDRRAGKSPSTQAGEFVRDKIRRGEHGARSAKQAIAIGLSEARRAGVELPLPKRGQASERTRRSAKYAYDAGHGHPHGTSSPKRSQASKNALKREGRSAASHAELSRQATTAARGRTASARSASARNASRTKGAAGRHAAAMKGARTRARHGR